MRWLSEETQYKRVILGSVIFSYSLLCDSGRGGQFQSDGTKIAPWGKYCAHMPVYACARSHTRAQAHARVRSYMCYTQFSCTAENILTVCGFGVCSFSPPCVRMCANARDYQVTLGLFGQEEEVISNPLSPGVIQGIIYSKCSPHGGEREAVLQQELVIHIGWIISNNPELFSGMLKIRVGQDTFGCNGALTTLER